MSDTEGRITHQAGDLRYDWDVPEIEALFSLPFNDLVFRAQQVHRLRFDPNQVQLSTLLSIKTGGCQEDCKYCSQSSSYPTGTKPDRLMETEDVVEAARAAKAGGATRFCMGAAWREPKGKSFDRVLEMIRKVKAFDMETCATLGMLTSRQAIQLKEAGLDYYNHNLDTDPEYYDKIITTRSFEDRLNTLKHVRAAGLHVCCGGIIGLGETRRHRAGMIASFARMRPHPESVPINMLVRIPGTPLEDTDALDGFELVRTIAAARITMPGSYVRLSAGREGMNDELQALCFLAGANSIFYGERLLTTGNRRENLDLALLERLGLRPEEQSVPSSRYLANSGLPSG